MYTRILSRRCFKRFISTNFSRKNTHVTITAYQYSSEIASNRSITCLARNLHSSHSFCREADTTAMSGQGGKAFNSDYKQILEAQKDENILIVDVREQPEIDETGKLPGSIHIPMGDVSNMLLNLSEKEFKEKYGKHKPTKNTKIIFSCRSGKRSGMVQEAVQKLGYKNAYNYTGGWLDWENRQKA